MFEPVGHGVDLLPRLYAEVADCLDEQVDASLAAAVYDGADLSLLPQLMCAG